jgi:hypothetical protein
VVASREAKEIRRQKRWRFMSLGLATSCVYRQKMSFGYPGGVLCNCPHVEYSPLIFEVINVKQGRTHWLPLGHVAVSLVR